MSNWKESFKAKLSGLIKSTTAWFNSIVACLSGLALALPDVLSSIQVQLSQYSPAINAKTGAWVGLTLGVISVVLRSRTSAKK